MTLIILFSSSYIALKCIFVQVPLKNLALNGNIAETFPKKVLRAPAALMACVATHWYDNLSFTFVC